MSLEEINKWLDEEYGCSYTKLEELHDFYFEKYCDLQQENKELKKQLEEFINYMMNTIENITHDETDDEEIKGYLIQRGNTFKEILSKYKEIIGGLNDK